MLSKTETKESNMQIGANLNDSGKCEFSVWAPLVSDMKVKIIHPEEKVIQMQKDVKGYWHIVTEEITEGMKYLYIIDNQIERPDPASYSQVDGVHAASVIVNQCGFEWEDRKWKGVELKDLVIYEIHVGTFTVEGTFIEAAKKLDYLKETGITAIEIMPIAHFPGNRNWGYDGVNLFAPHTAYGGVMGLKHFVNEAHKADLAVILDVVYNHLGPEGNYLGDFGPYFSSNYKTPWGQALNFDYEYSDDVKNYFFENIRYWFKYYHIDGLRLDAIDKIIDLSAEHFLKEAASIVKEISLAGGKKHFLIAESDLNDSRIIDSNEKNGYGIDAQWADDFHHSVHSILTGEREGYYADFGNLDHLIKAIKSSFVYDGCYSLSRLRKHGNSCAHLSYDKFVICLQNHDQVGNRALGDRLPALISFEGLKLAAGTMLFMPSIPLIFMGEEYGEDNPFQYFVSFTDADLIELVRNGRREEFSSFGWGEKIPDPSSQETFIESKLDWEKIKRPPYSFIYRYYKDMLLMRKKHSLLKLIERKNLECEVINGDIIRIVKKDGSGKELVSFGNWSKKEKNLDSKYLADLILVLDSYSDKYGGLSKNEIMRNEKIIMPYQFKVFEKGN